MDWYWSWGTFAISIFIFLLGILIGGTLREEKYKRDQIDLAIKNTIDQ